MLTVRGRILAATTALALAGLGLAAVATATPAYAASPPPTPASEELHADYDSSITMSWPATPGATSYNIYRATTSGAEGNTPYATTTALSFKDSNLSPTPIYFYELSAVNSAGESGRTAEDASKTPPPQSTAGNIAGVASGNSLVFYGKDARLTGFDWFQTLTGWFPQALGSSGSISPTQQVIDMAYAQAGAMTFTNVNVATAGLYTVDWRYAFQGGLFPAVKNRRMGVTVNGTVITSSESFPITGSFDVYQHSALQVHLNAGVNSVALDAVSDHGVSRVDQLTVTPATASVPSGPTNLVATPGNGSVALSWTASSSGSPTSYSVWRGTASDGEATTAVGTTNGSTTSFTDTGLTNGTTYYYFVTANNGVGGSPTTNEVTAVPTTNQPPATPTGLTATAGNGSVTLNWATDAGATSYSIYRGTTSGGESATAVGTSTTTSFTNTGLTNGTTYYYRITASNAAGTSGNSAEVSAKPAAPTSPPPAPTGVSATAGNASVSLSWTASSTATSYSIFRGTTSGGESATAVGTATGTSFTDTGLTNGTTYFYRITASNSAGASGNSAEVSATPNNSGTPPPVPFGVVITPRTGNILLQWGFESAATSYHVFRSTTPGGEGATPYVTTTSPTYIDTAVTSGTTYYYEFSALTGTAESARTAEFSAKAL
jgi:fibronectin type 3 domain-containing protein